MKAHGYRIHSIIIAIISLGSIAHGQRVGDANTNSSFEHVEAAGRFDDVLKILEKSVTSELLEPNRWRMLVKQHRPGIEESATHGEFSERLNRLFQECGISHLHYFAESDWRYWLFLGQLGFGKDDLAAKVDHVGILPKKIDGQWIRTRYTRGVPRSGDRFDYRRPYHHGGQRAVPSGVVLSRQSWSHDHVRDRASSRNKEGNSSHTCS